MIAHGSSTASSRLIVSPQTLEAHRILQSEALARRLSIVQDHYRGMPQPPRLVQMLDASHQKTSPAENALTRIEAIVSQVPLHKEVQ